MKPVPRFPWLVSLLLHFASDLGTARIKPANFVPSVIDASVTLYQSNTKLPSCHRSPLFFFGIVCLHSFLRSELPTLFVSRLPSRRLPWIPFSALRLTALVLSTLFVPVILWPQLFVQTHNLCWCCPVSANLHRRTLGRKYVFACLERIKSVPSGAPMACV